LPIFDQILSLQISLVIKPSDLCELNDTVGRKGDQQRIGMFMVRIIINIKHERGCLLGMSFLSGVALPALSALSIKARKQKKTEPLCWRCLCQLGSGFRCGCNCGIADMRIYHKNFKGCKSTDMLEITQLLKGSSI
jgi:hypothetical protein